MGKSHHWSRMARSHDSRKSRMSRGGWQFYDPYWWAFFSRLQHQAIYVLRYFQWLIGWVVACIVSSSNSHGLFGMCLSYRVSWWNERLDAWIRNVADTEARLKNDIRQKQRQSSTQKWMGRTKPSKGQVLPWFAKRYNFTSRARQCWSSHSCAQWWVEICLIDMQSQDVPPKKYANIRKQYKLNTRLLLSIWLCISICQYTVFLMIRMIHHRSIMIPNEIEQTDDLMTSGYVVWRPHRSLN